MAKKNNLSKANKLPIPSKQEYSCLCEVIEEFYGNSNYLNDKVSQEIKKNALLYQGYLNADQSNIVSHYHVYPSFDFGDGYIAYACMVRAEKKEILAISLTKEFVLEDGGDDMVMGNIYPDNTDKPQLAFFTRPFFECFSDSTKLGKDLFFAGVALNGYISECSGKVRWLFSEGAAFGYRYCQYYVFNEFSDKMKYQGEKLTDERIEELDDLLWNTEW